MVATMLPPQPPLLLLARLHVLLLVGLASSSPLLLDRAVKLQQEVDAAIASRAPATIELSGTYTFNRSSLLIIGSTSELTLQPSPSCVAPGCVPELLFSIWRCGEEPTDGPDCSLINFADPNHPPTCKSAANVSCACPNVVWSSGINVSSSVGVTIKGVAVDYAPRSLSDGPCAMPLRPAPPSPPAGTPTKQFNSGRKFTLNLFNSSRCVVEDLTIRHAPFMAITSFLGDGGHVFRRVVFQPDPKNSNAMIAGKDGLHESDVRHGLQFLDSTIHGTADDFFNFHNTLQLVYKCDTFSRSCLIINPHIDAVPLNTIYGSARVLSNVRSGDVFSFYPLACHNAGECINSTFTNLATLSVTETHEVTDTTLLREVAAWSVKTYTNKSNGLMHFGEGSDLWNISFAAAPAADFAKLCATNLVNVDTMSGSGAVIDSCVFSVTACNLGRIKTSDTRVTNTTMSQAVGHNLEITGLQVWFEGPVSMNNINVSNNTFIGEGNSVVHISKAATNVTVSGNVYKTDDESSLAAAHNSPSWESTPLKVFILAGQSNMEGQAELNTTYGKACREQLPGQAPVCCSKHNVTGCCPDVTSHGKLQPCAPFAPAHRPPNSDPCPHDIVQGPTNDHCYKNGTLKYQTLDPRTRDEFTQCWDTSTNDWTVLKDIKIWFQEGSGCWLSPNATCAQEDRHKNSQKLLHPCPKAYCDSTDPASKVHCNESFVLGGCGRWGSMAPHFGAGKAHGPEYSFGWQLHNDPTFKQKDEQILLIKVAYGGTSLAGNWRPPSSVNQSGGKVGGDYTAMLHYVRTVLEPQNLKLYFPDLKPRPSHDIVGFAWFQGWQDGCSSQDASHYEQNLVNLMHDVRRDLNISKLPFSVPITGFAGWDVVHNPRRNAVVQAQFAACDPKKHPEAQPAIAEETRNFVRPGPPFSPSPQNFVSHPSHACKLPFVMDEHRRTGLTNIHYSTTYLRPYLYSLRHLCASHNICPSVMQHFGHNAETYWRIGKTMAVGMLDMLLNRPRPVPVPAPPPPPRPPPPPPPKPNQGCGSGPSANVVCSCVSDGQEISLKCPAGKTVMTVNFASLGTPSGKCGHLLASSNCSGDTAEAKSVISKHCLHKNACVVAANTKVLNGNKDPCYGVAKSTYVQATCK
jgi:hypothetical protein